jgi:pimeloyl-ACP methyl ester carboxylesterase
MIHFNNSGQTYLFPILIFSVLSISLLMLNIQVEIVRATITNTTETRIPVYEITTRGNLVSAHGVNGSGYRDTYQLADIRNLNDMCPEEVAIFVHGWGQNETEAKERLDRVKMSLEKYNYSFPLVGFSWDSDTEWVAAQSLAKWNGPKLADYIAGLMDNCKQHHSKDIKIRLIGHSLGARVILSSLDSLHKNVVWNNSNFKLASVHLLGAAVDDEEVTTNPRDILEDKTNWGSPKSDYGGAIQEEVVRFYNLYNPKDNVFEQIYPLFEGDFALGQRGHQVLPYQISFPTNYEDVNVTKQIKAIYDADGFEADVFGLCHNNNDYCKIKSEGWDFGFCNLLIVPPICQPPGIGDNHAGYIGFRNLTNQNLLADEGAMNVVVTNWRNNG